MNYIRRSSKIATSIIFSLLIFILMSCVSNRAKNESVSQALSIKKIEHNEILNIAPLIVNPYIEPASIIRGKLYEFMIIQLDITLPTEENISVIGELKLMSDNKTVANPYYREQFIEFYNNQFQHDTYAENKYNTKMLNIISDTCLPSSNFTQKPGAKRYYLPFIGKNPIPRPSQIYVQVTVGNSEPVIYTVDL